MYKLVEEASKVLRTPPDEFDFNNPPEDPKVIEKNLGDLIEKWGGLGLSANQIGLPYRVFVMRTADKGTMAFFNPEIKRLSQETDLLREGCLSFPDIYLMIKRPKNIEFTFTDSSGEEQILMMDGMGARCAQHEIDHLNGILFLQRASQLKIERAIKARPKERRKRLDYERRQAAKHRSIQTHDGGESSVGGTSTGADSVVSTA